MPINALGSKSSHLSFFLVPMAENEVKQGFEDPLTLIGNCRGYGKIGGTTSNNTESVQIVPWDCQKLEFPRNSRAPGLGPSFTYDSDPKSLNFTKF